MLALVGCVATLTACSSSSKPSADATTTYPAATMASEAPVASGTPATSTAPSPSTSTSQTKKSPPKSPTPATTAHSTSSQPTVPADVPRTGPNVTSKAEKPPVMPAGATKHTAQGAKSFAVFFVRTIDWGYATTDSHYMRHYFTHSCTLCLAFADEFDNTKSAKHHYLGDRIHIRSSSATAGQDEVYACRVVADVDAATSVEDRTGNVIKGGAPISKASLFLKVSWVRRSWTVTSMREQDN